MATEEAGDERDWQSNQLNQYTNIADGVTNMLRDYSSLMGCLDGRF